jgi:hypothetical protein
VRSRRSPLRGFSPESASAVETITSALWACSSDRPRTGPVMAHASDDNSRLAAAVADAESLMVPPTNASPIRKLVPSTAAPTTASAGAAALMPGPWAFPGRPRHRPTVQ